jgi:hypothetical protein
MLSKVMPALKKCLKLRKMFKVEKSMEWINKV